MNSGEPGLLSGPAQPGDRWRLLAATAFGLGRFPAAPGTFGTLGGVALAWLLAQSGTLYLPLLSAALVLLYALGRSLGNWADRRARAGDPGWFVLDEVLGYLVVLFWPVPPSPLALVVAFAWFRLFDITKPWPARRLERLPGGDGILLDDVIAGVYGLLALWACREFLLTPAAWTAPGFG